MSIEPFDLGKVRVFPLETRKSQSRLEEVLVNPDGPAPELNQLNAEMVSHAATQIKRARERSASVMLIYGAHLVKNGAQTLVIELINKGWLTHIATNGAGIIHDWEFSFLGRSTESVRDNVAAGTFGTWDETGKFIHLALVSGALFGLGFGSSLGKLMEEDGVTLPSVEALTKLLREQPGHPLTPARAEALAFLVEHKLERGLLACKHPWKSKSVIYAAYKKGIPFTVHPGIGYDIISNHPMFNGAALGRAAAIDFRLFASSVEKLDEGAVLSVGSAIMGPQVFEKTISCVNNVRLQNNKNIVSGHSIYVVDLQDGGNWDWRQGEPPKENPAYYLRFCKSFSRMGGAMHYLQCDNVAFIHNLLRKVENG